MTDTPHEATEPSTSHAQTSRRSVIAGLGATALGIAAVGIAASSSAQASTTAEGAAAAEAAAGTPQLAAACTLTPQQTVGPYYLDLDTVRKNITEGKPGLTLTLRVTVIDSVSCAPLPNTAVDIWQCDAKGIYSGYVAGGSTPDTTFLRGVQLTDASGVAEFTTLYPGWYACRAIHIHIKTHTGGTVVNGKYNGGTTKHTGQLYFPEDWNTRVAALNPYRTNTTRRTLNASDGIYRNGGSATLQTVTQVGSDINSGVIGAVTVAVRSA